MAIYVWELHWSSSPGAWSEQLSRARTLSLLAAKQKWDNNFRGSNGIRTSFTSILYSQFPHMIFIIYTSRDYLIMIDNYQTHLPTHHLRNSRGAQRYVGFFSLLIVLCECCWLDIGKPRSHGTEVTTKAGIPRGQKWHYSHRSSWVWRWRDHLPPPQEARHSTEETENLRLPSKATTQNVPIATRSPLFALLTTKAAAITKITYSFQCQRWICLNQENF